MWSLLKTAKPRGVPRRYPTTPRMEAGTTKAGWAILKAIAEAVEAPPIHTLLATIAVSASMCGQSRPALKQFHSHESPKVVRKWTISILPMRLGRKTHLSNFLDAAVQSYDGVEQA